MEKPSIGVAVSKLAIAGQQAGFSIEQLMMLLNAGCNVETLVQIISRRLEADDLWSLGENVFLLPWLM